MGDPIELSNGQTVPIPARHRTNYWAILSYMYTRPDEPVSAEELVAGVREAMLASDPLKWSRFEQKSMHKTVKGGEVTIVETHDWRSRLITNARNLCRLGGMSGYGKRLLAQGHVLRCEMSDDILYFTLSTKLTAENLSPKRRGRKRSK